MSELMGEKSGLNDMGPTKQLSQPPTGQTGCPDRQTGLAQADRIKFELVICHMSFELMIVVNLITGN